MYLVILLQYITIHLFKLSYNIIHLYEYIQGTGADLDREHQLRPRPGGSASSALTRGCTKIRAHNMAQFKALCYQDTRGTCRRLVIPLTYLLYCLCYYARTVCATTQVPQACAPYIYILHHIYCKNYSGEHRLRGVQYHNII